MEHHKADVWQVAGRGMAGDDTVRFLRELRQLRDGAGLGHAELAARAHYPYDLIKAAEAGPSLPDLPVLSAYVRGCGGTAEEWEERWRTLTRTPSLPVSAARHAGNSAAASAGARIGATTQVVDAPDPSVIMAALNRVAEGMAGGDPDVDAAPLTVPPQPAFPGDDVSAPAVVPPSVVPPADIPLADVSLGDISLGGVSMGGVSMGDNSLGGVSLDDNSLGDVSMGDTSLPDAFAAGAVSDPLAVPADFSPFAPVAAADDPLVAPSDDLVAPADDSAAGSLGGPAEPAADDGPKGWDPIRVSAAWPAIGSEDPRGTRVAGDDAALGWDIPPWDEAPAPRRLRLPLSRRARTRRHPGRTRHHPRRQPRPLRRLPLAHRRGTERGPSSASRPGRAV